MSRFKSKKRYLFKLKFLLYILVIYFVYQLIMYINIDIQLSDNNEDFIKNLIANSNYHLLYERKSKNIIYKLGSILTSINIKKPISILENNFNYSSSNQNASDIEPNDIGGDSVKEIIKYIDNTTSNEISNPLVYIYNSHQTEMYSTSNLDGYNVTPNVLMASVFLKEKLDALGIPTIVEKADISEFMRLNNWDYNYSYKASRYYVEDTMKKYNSIKLYIDLHRDALKKSNSTVSIDGKSYAKILFVVGKAHSNYEPNLRLANSINAKIEKNYPTLTRGVITKEGSGVNGIYNQNLSPNMILLEVGGQENTIGEVINTLDIISEVIKEQLNEK